MDLEKETISYLGKYGNTREEDLVDYLVHNLHCSSGKTKKVLHRMVINGQIHRLVHEKLGPPRVYITLEVQIRPEALNDTVDTRTSFASRSEVQEILREAAMLAEKRMQDAPTA